MDKTDTDQPAPNGRDVHDAVHALLSEHAVTVQEMQDRVEERLGYLVPRRSVHRALERLRRRGMAARRQHRREGRPGFLLRYRRTEAPSRPVAEVRVARLRYSGDLDVDRIIRTLAMKTRCPRHRITTYAVDAGLRALWREVSSERPPLRSFKERCRALSRLDARPFLPKEEP